MCFAPTQCGEEENNVCFTCNEASHLVNNTCTPCPNDCRRCNGPVCLECATPFVPVDCGFVEAEHARLTDGRQAVRCDDGWVASGTGCSACSARCQKSSETSCEICDGAFNNGTCVSPPGAELTTNNGMVSCHSGSSLTNNTCVSCDAFGGACQRCSPDGCLGCTDAVVRTNGTCYGRCDEITNGECVCAPNQHFNGSECVACDDHCKICDGEVCSVCEEGFSINENTGAVRGDGRERAGCLSPDRAVLRCTDGFFATDSGSCELCVGCATCLDEDTCLSCGTNETLVETSC